MTAASRWSVGILLFDGVAALDVAGPLEVLSRARLEPGLDSRFSEEKALFDVFTVARTREPVTATGGLTLLPGYSFEEAPPIDLLVVPGGFGTRPLLQDADTIEWIRRTAAAARRTASVCTGALLLARAGLLDNRRATTHWGAFGLLASLGKGITVDREARFVDDGVLTSAGLASGMDLALHVVETLFGRAVADETARYIEYRRG
jgi:transcriptional regulator GlxA family with amidase domain